MITSRIFALAFASLSMPLSLAATFTLRPAEGDVKIEWGSMPRPAPLPPLKHAAMLLPVSVEGIQGKPLLMQFDLGHTKTVLYSKKWADMARRLGAGTPEASVPMFTFTLGSVTVTARDVEVMQREGAPINWDNDSPEVIGTIGTDFIDGKVVTLDFKRGRVALATARDPARTTGFQPFKFEGRRLLLPAEFEGKKLEVMYDSGSSAFAWLTSEKEFARLATPGAQVQSYPVRSWDKMVTAVTAPTAATVTIGGTTFPIGEVSRIDGMGFMQRMSVSMLGAGGMVGNKLFLDRTLVIDMTNREFAVF
ncbi:MAG: hypothetical protein JNM76_18740 [Betaproteobacteria bacterium]|nr:hypothetical protein [Betaproteobacteria bacterium]